MSNVLSFPNPRVVKKVRIMAEPYADYPQTIALGKFIGLTKSFQEGVLDMDDPQHVAYLIRRMQEITAEYEQSKEPKVPA